MGSRNRPLQETSIQRRHSVGEVVGASGDTQSENTDPGTNRPDSTSRPVTSFNCRSSPAGRRETERRVGWSNVQVQPVGAGAAPGSPDGRDDEGNPEHEVGQVTEDRRRQGRAPV